MSSTEVQYGRAVRPFPVRRLLRRVAALHGRVGYLAEVMASLAESESQGPSAWRHELGELGDCLEALIEEAEALSLECSALYDRADADWERAVRAMQAILAGLSPGDAGEVEATAEPVA